MVSKKSIDKQLKRIGFKTNGWGKGEINELPNIILPDEEIYECVNGIYDGGFALLVATDIRVLLIDQKPLNYLTVEDLRFDMISEMDYSHRLFGARISISAGDKNLKFLSYNQPRLRKLIGHVQHCMAESKKQQSNHAEGQVQHLEKINEQLQEYLLAQQRQQNKLQEQLTQVARGTAGEGFEAEDIKLSHELSDYLFAQSLLAQHREHEGVADDKPGQLSSNSRDLQDGDTVEVQQTEPQTQATGSSVYDELYESGLKEVFGKYSSKQEQPAADKQKHFHQKALEINPINIAYSKLPMVLRNRKFGRPSLPAVIRPESIANTASQTVNANQANGA